MKTFFHGWRRKAGCFTLLGACVFMGAWMRSLWVADWIFLPYRQSLMTIVTDPGLVLIATESDGDAQSVSAPGWMSELRSTSNVDAGSTSIIEFSESNGMRWVWHWQSLGFARGGEPGVVFTWFTVPYWMVVIPLTLLSAYLILGFSLILPARKQSSSNVTSAKN